MSHFEHETETQDKRTNKSSVKTSQTTAYQSNTRKAFIQSSVDYTQNDKIKSLLERDYAFLPLNYRPPGFLFRGLESGLNAGVRDGSFGLNGGSHSLAALERDLGVVLVSADFSDALSVSRLWETNDDAGILVIAADVFDRRYTQHAAATLGFAEPGVVFKYPFFAEPIPINEISYLIVHRRQVDELNNSFNQSTAIRKSASDISGSSTDNLTTAGSFLERLIVIDEDSSLANRSSLNNYLNECLASRDISKAAAVQAENYPQK